MRFCEAKYKGMGAIFVLVMDFDFEDIKVLILITNDADSVIKHLR